MGTLLKLIGIVCVLMWIAGAVIPGWHCHIIFGGDEFAAEAHETMARKIRAKLNQGENDGRT